MPVGKVIRSHSNIHYVLIDGDEVECRARGRLRLDKQSVLVGDMVEVLLDEDGGGSIQKVLPRQNVLQRPSVANVDLALMVFTLKDPEADYPFLDRVLIHAEQANVKVVILLNKIDLVEPTEVDCFCRQYGEQVGYQVLPISAANDKGLDRLRPLLTDRIAVLAGNSGVGKSHLVRTLEPARQDIRVGGLSVKLGRGKHTTRHVELVALSAGGLIVDTPGFTYLDFQDITKWDLGGYFREFRRYAGECRFDDCLHRAEPDCAVHAAVDDGKIVRSRYDHYLLFLKEVEALKRW